jgi:hypothetical protein
MTLAKDDPGLVECNRRAGPNKCHGFILGLGVVLEPVLFECLLSHVWGNHVQVHANNVKLLLSAVEMLGVEHKQL